LVDLEEVCLNGGIFRMNQKLTKEEKQAKAERRSESRE
jgi:hypothetical protein